MITEPTLEEYVYYLRRVEGDNRKAIQERRAAFEGELRALLAHVERLSSQAIPMWEWPQEPEGRLTSQIIMRTDWLDNPATGRCYFVSACVYGDLYWLQVGHAQHGQAGPEVFASLRDEAWQPAAANHLLGRSDYLCGIADAVDQHAAQALAAYTGDTPDTIVSTHLANGRAGLYGSPWHPYIAVLFYPDAKCEEWAGQTILNDIALRFELYKHKADRQLAWCEENYPILSEQERALRDLLEKVDQPSLADLETLRQLVQLYRVFNSNVGMLVERQMTIGINLKNLDVVLKDLGPLTEDQLLGSIRDHLRRRQEQLQADLKFADQLRQQAEGTINAFRIDLDLDRLVDLQTELRDLASIERTGWPGTLPPSELEISPLISPSKPPEPAVIKVFGSIVRFLRSLTPQVKTSQPVTYPQITPSPAISLTPREKDLLRRVYQGFGQVLVEEKFGGGYSGTQVLLTLPVTPIEAGGLRAARKVTKLGSALELRKERDNYEQYVEDFLPFCVAQVEGDRYFEQDDWAGLNYVFVGGGALGQVVSLEEYYRRAVSSQAVDRVIGTLRDLLGRGLGQGWYSQSVPLSCFFAAEYSRHMVEHLRLRLRPASPDALWLEGQSAAPVADYRQLEVNAIPHEHETVQPGTLLAVEGLVVSRVRRGVALLQDPDSQGIVVGAELGQGSEAAQGLALNDVVGLRGEVVYNRHVRMKQIVRAVFPDLPAGVDDERIEVPGESGMHPNPLRVYPQVLSSMLEGRQSYVHGDLHLRNVLVDESGKGWLIDFAEVEKRHNLFDFIRLETYVRLMGLAGGDPSFSLGDYAQFEKALSVATLEEDGETCPDNTDLQAAYQVILATRRIARRYMTPNSGFVEEYFPALLLHSLGAMRYWWEDAPLLTRLIFVTASVLSYYILGINR